MHNKILTVFVVLLMTIYVSASTMAGSVGAAKATGIDAVLYNPASLAKQSQRLVGGGYSYNDEKTQLVLGYLEPGFSNLYDPKISNFRLAGGITWVRTPGLEPKNQYYYTIVFCTQPVYGGLNLIYKPAATPTYGMDLSLAVDWFDKLTTAITLKDILTWTGNRNAPLTSAPQVRLALSYQINEPLAMNFDIVNTSGEKTDLSLGASYDTGSLAFRGGVSTETTFEQFVPSLGFSYRGNHGDFGRFSLNLSLNYKDNKIGHSAVFSYSFL